MQRKIRIDSPHSIKAIQLIGARLEDLKFISLDEYNKKNIGSQYLEKELQEERYNHYEKNRLDLINEAKKIREQLIKEEEDDTNQNNTINNRTSSLYLSPKNNVSKSFDLKTMKKTTSSINIEPKYEASTAIKLEREKLQKVLEKQEIKVKLQIDYECMIEENRRKNLEKMMEKEKKEEKRRKEKEREIMEKKEREREKMMEKKRKE